MNWTVAITGMNARPDNPGPGLAVARCLREAADFKGRIVGMGYDVLDAGLYPATPCGGHYSGAMADSGYLLPFPATGEEAMLERILEIHELEGLDAIIPCLDAELPCFVALESRLRQRGIRCILPTAAMLRARSKDQLMELCAKANVHVPQTKLISDSSFFRNCTREGWSYPLVVKGIFYDAVVAYTPETAEAAFHRLAQQWGYPVLVQKFYEGQELNLTGLGYMGKLLSPVMMRKRALTDKGKGWAGVTVVDEQLERMASSLVETLGWRGPLEVEVLRADDGKLYLIEINPRFPAWIFLSAAVGRNLPRILLDLMRGLTPENLAPLKPGQLFIRYAQEMVVDLSAFESLVMQGSLDSAVVTERSKL